MWAFYEQCLRLLHAIASMGNLIIDLVFSEIAGVSVLSLLFGGGLIAYLGVKIALGVVN